MKPKIFLLSCLSFIIFNFSFIIGTVRYVSPTGSSTPPYTTWETAADSIMECINISVFGDTIYVANGTYKEQVVMIPGLSLIGAGMDSCVIDTRELTLTSEFFTVHGFDNSYLSNFKIFTYDVQNGSGILIDGGLNSVYKFCEINEAYFGFAIFSSAQNNPLVYQNMIKTVSDGIICFGSPLISENIIYAHGNGLVSQINSSPTYINNIIHCADCYLGFYDALGFISKLESNIFYRTGTESGDGAFQSYGNDSIINNVVYGIEVGWDHGLFGVGTIAANNHFQNVNTVLVYDQIAGSPQTFQYNNLWDYETASLNISIDSTNMYSDPMFANPDSLDFHLQKYSPLIDAGDPTILDKDGTRSDIGLYGGPYGEQYHYIDLAPRTPINLTATLDSLTVGLTWNKNTEADFNHYNVYRDTTKNFQIDSTNLFLSTDRNNLIDFLPDYLEKIYYKITAIDNQGNESEPSEEVGFILTSVTDHQQTISDYRLYQNYPNPFNPSTKISYRLKERGYVKLYVYDIKGELISVLVNKTQEAGFYEVEFVGNGLPTVQNNSDLASGIYIYQIMVKNENNIPVFTDMKKMIYLK